MGRNIVFAAGAAENELARWLHDSLRERTFARGKEENTWRQRELQAIRATVGFVAKDRRLTVTLRCDRGSVIVHDGAIGTPDITFFAGFDTLTELTTLPLSPVLQLPFTMAWGMFVTKLATSELTIFGLVSHPRLAFRIARLLAPAGAGAGTLV